MHDNKLSLSHLRVSTFEKWPYEQALEWMFVTKVQVQENPSHICVAVGEHNPAVITLGRHSDENQIICKNSQMPIYRIERGGLATIHGPGQLIFYPVLNLNYWGIGAKKLVCLLEETFVQTVPIYAVSDAFVIPVKTGIQKIIANANIPNDSELRQNDMLLENNLYESMRQESLLHHSPKGPGLYINNKKVAFIGLRIEDGISQHGLSFNISNDLKLFKAIIPCGDKDAVITSLQNEGLRLKNKREFIQAFVKYFGEKLNESIKST